MAESATGGGLAKRTREVTLPALFGGRESFFDGIAPLDLLMAGVAWGLTTSARTSSASMNAAPLATIPRESVARSEALLQSLATTYALFADAGNAPPVERPFNNWTSMAPCRT